MRVSAIKLDCFYIYIQSPKICSSFVDNLICFMGTGMIDSMLEPHMKNTANATQTEVGLTFMIYAFVYTVAGLIAGYVSLELVQMSNQVCHRYI